MVIVTLITFTPVIHVVDYFTIYDTGWQLLTSSMPLCIYRVIEGQKGEIDFVQSTYS